MAFTKVELVVVIIVAFALLLLLLGKLSFGVYQQSDRIRCVSNLKNIGLGFRIVASNNDGRYPDWPNANTDSSKAEAGEFVSEYFLSFSNHLKSFDIIICPSDNRPSATSWQTLSGTNISYFMATRNEPMTHATLLAGDRNLTLDDRELGSGIHTIERNQNLGWTDKIHKGSGNVALGDGSVQQLSQRRLAHFATNQSFPQQIAIP